MIYPTFIYDLGDRYAHGRAGERALRVVRATLAQEAIGLAPSYTTKYVGVRGRKPIIPVDAPKVWRRDAGRALCKALGV